MARPWSAREIALLLAVLSVAAAMAMRVRPMPAPPPESLYADVAQTLRSTGDCHCGVTHLPTSDRHVYRALADPAVLPTGIAPAHMEIWQRNHFDTYVEWWNLDEGLLKVAAGDPSTIRQAMDRMRLSAQNVILCGAHADTVLGTAQERRAPSPLLDRLAEIEAAAPDRLAASLPPEESWLVIGADLRRGRIVAMAPNTQATSGLWGALPLITLDFHRTAHAFDFGVDEAARRDYLETLWPQINRRAVERRHAQAIERAGAPFAVDAGSPVPLSESEVAALNAATLQRVRWKREEFPTEVQAGLRELLGEDWRSALGEIVASAPWRCVVGEVMETGQIEVFHVGEAHEGVWGVEPLIAFAPEQATLL